jgi:hypothetical protein
MDDGCGGHGPHFIVKKKIHLKKLYDKKLKTYVSTIFLFFFRYIGEILL